MKELTKSISKVVEELYLLKTFLKVAILKTDIDEDDSLKTSFSISEDDSNNIVKKYKPLKENYIKELISSTLYNNIIQKAIKDVLLKNAEALSSSMINIIDNEIEDIITELFNEKD